MTWITGAMVGAAVFAPLLLGVLALRFWPNSDPEPRTLYGWRPSMDKHGNPIEEDLTPTK